MEVTRELDFTLENLLIDSHGIVIVEWIDSGNHLVGQDAESPPIDWLAVAFVEKHLWSEVFGSTAEGVCACLAVLGETEISQSEVAFSIDEDVFWLQITVNDVQRVKIFEHQGHLSRVEPAKSQEND